MGTRGKHFASGSIGVIGSSITPIFTSSFLVLKCKNNCVLIDFFPFLFPFSHCWKKGEDKRPQRHQNKEETSVQRKPRSHLTIQKLLSGYLWNYLQKNSTIEISTSTSPDLVICSYMQKGFFFYVIKLMILRWEECF